MKPLDRKIALMRSNIRPIDIAREAQVNPTTVYRVIEDLSVSDRIQRMIAKAIGQPVENVFPERYKSKVRMAS